jgi:hypothetical protein
VLAPLREIHRLGDDLFFICADRRRLRRGLSRRRLGAASFGTPCAHPPCDVAISSRSLSADPTAEEQEIDQCDHDDRDE